MQLGAVTYNVLKDMDVETIIRTLEAAGLAAVELRTTHKHGVEPSLSPEERRKVKERFAASKVRLLSYGTTCEFHSPDPAERRRQVDIDAERAERLLVIRVILRVVGLTAGGGAEAARGGVEAVRFPALHERLHLLPLGPFSSGPPAEAFTLPDINHRVYASGRRARRPQPRRGQRQGNEHKQQPEHPSHKGPPLGVL